MEIHKFHQEVLLVPPCLVFGPEERGAMVIPVWWNGGQLSVDLRLSAASWFGSCFFLKFVCWLVGLPWKVNRMVIQTQCVLHYFSINPSAETGCICLEPHGVSLLVFSSVDTKFKPQLRSKKQVTNPYLCYDCSPSTPPLRVEDVTNQHLWAAPKQWGRSQPTASPLARCFTPQASF